MRPKYRSKLSAIHVVSIVHQKNISIYGIDAVIKPFVDEIKKLVSCMLNMHNLTIICRKRDIPFLLMGKRRYVWNVNSAVLLLVVSSRAVHHTGAVGIVWQHSRLQELRLVIFNDAEYYAYTYNYSFQRLSLH